MANWRYGKKKYHNEPIDQLIFSKTDEVSEEWKDTEIFKMLKKHVDEGNINE